MLEFENTKIIENENTEKQKSIELNNFFSKIRNKLNELANNINTKETKKESNWDNPEYFSNSKIITTDNTYKKRGIVIKRDVGMNYYVVNRHDLVYTTARGEKGEIIKIVNKELTIKRIRQKLYQNTQEFAYLKKSEYNNDTFALTPGFENLINGKEDSYMVPIPMESENRRIKDEEFKKYSKNGIERIKQDKLYGKYRKGIDTTNLSALFTAIAKMETGKKRGEAGKIGDQEYYHRDQRRNCIAIGPLNIPLDKECKKVLENLKMNGYFNTIGQSYHPQNATMLFMGYVVEKLKAMNDKWDDKIITDIINKKLGGDINIEKITAFSQTFCGIFYTKDYNKNLLKLYNSEKKEAKNNGN